MIFLPNLQERYLAALRLHLQNSALRDGSAAEILHRLKAVMLCEALISREAEPLDILPFADSLLGAAVILLLKHGRRLRVRLAGGGSALVNRRLLTALLLLSAAECGENGEITVTAGEGQITVGLCEIGQSRALKSVTAALHGTLLSLAGESRAVISVPVALAEGAARQMREEWEYLLDGFSPVNVFLESVGR